MIDDSTPVQFFKAPDPMRRIPQQARSRRMANNIVEAAFNILKQHGRDGLSTTSLELVSGVPKSTVYEYFPNLDAVVSEVFHDVMRRHMRDGYNEYPLDSPQTVLSFCAWLVDWVLGIHQELLTLDKSFYLEYGGFFDFWQALDVTLHPQSTVLTFLSEQLYICSDFKPSADDSMLVRALGRSIQMMTYAMLHDNTSFVNQEGFRNLLIRLSYSIFSCNPKYEQCN